MNKIVCGSYEYPVHDGAVLHVNTDRPGCSGYGGNDFYDLGFKHEEIEDHGIQIHAGGMIIDLGKGDRATDKLVEAALQGSAIGARTPIELLQEMNNPKFEEKKRVHNWRNYIDEALVALWGELPMEARLAAYIGAIKKAEAEDWD